MERKPKRKRATGAARSRGEKFQFWGEAKHLAVLDAMARELCTTRTSVMLQLIEREGDRRAARDEEAARRSAMVAAALTADPARAVGLLSTGEWVEK